MLLARIIVTPRPVLNDPQGRAVQRGLETLGFDEVDDVRVGKYLEVRLDLESKLRAEARVREMCERLLANQVIEDFRFEIGPLEPENAPAAAQSPVSPETAVSEAPQPSLSGETGDGGGDGGPGGGGDGDEGGASEDGHPR